jgi:hypothetical protein
MLLWYGIAGFILIMALSFARRTDIFENFCVGFLLVVFLLLMMIPTMIESAVRPLTWDARLQAADLRLGLDGFVWARIWLGTKWLRIISTQAYWGLPLAFAISWSMERSRTMARSVILAGILTFPCYLLIPAAGPVYAFVGWPKIFAAGGTGLVAVSALHPRNCFPSMHLAWGLLLAMNASNKLWRGLLLVNVLLIGLATIGGGEHYFVDLIAAVPFAFVVQAVAERWPVWQERFTQRSCVGSVRPTELAEIERP